MRVVMTANQHTESLEFYFYCPVCREEYDSDGEMYRCPECLYSDYDDIDVGEEDDVRDPDEALSS